MDREKTDTKGKKNKCWIQLNSDESLDEITEDIQYFSLINLTFFHLKMEDHFQLQNF